MLQYRLDDDQGGPQPPKPWKGDEKKPEDKEDDKEESKEEKKQ